MGMIGPMVERLGLSDAQKDQVKTIMRSHAEEFQALAEREHSAHVALDQAMMADPPSDDTIRQASADVAAVGLDMALASVHVRAEVFQGLNLTDEQKAQVKKFVERRGGRGRGPRR
jgi:Spy/CpxP family protein refolding chaperone